ncbi:MAG: O-antigen ligase family protein [Bacteroidota bacterium]
MILIILLFNGNEIYFVGVLLLFVSLSFILIHSADFTYKTILILSFFPLIYLLRVHPAVILSPLLFFSIILNFHGEVFKKTSNPLWKSLIVFVVCTLPSLLNSQNILLSIRDFSNIIALLIIFFSTTLLVDTSEKIKKIFLVFIIVTLLHSVIVVYLGLTSKTRTFGPLGVYYIDYAGIGTVLTLILILYSDGLKKILFVIPFLIITGGLILTQTRNAWVSTLFAIFTLVLYLFLNSKKVFIKKRILVLLIVFISGIVLLSFFTTETNIEQRLDITEQSVTLTDDPESVGKNSFVSRMMIWHTSLVSFFEHPFIGIGVYAFKHTSQHYYQIPEGFYKLWVEGRTPHVTYLQVLTETGILGFLAFLCFIFSIIKLLMRILTLPRSKHEWHIAVMTIWALIYIIFSMMMTESWLYGPYIIWFGILLGILVNIDKQLRKNLMS